MFIIESYTTAVLFCIVTMLCWGSWANTQKLAAGSWRFELFYWDYVLGIVALALLSAFTLGSIGEGGRSFIADVQQASTANIGSAIWGGVLFNAANILLGAAIAIAGMSVAFPVGIGLALVIGVVVNYLNAPVGNAGLLFGGMALIVVAILLNAFAYRRTATGGTGLSTKGLLLSVVAGCLMGLFYGYVAQAMFPNFDVPEPGKLSPYTAVVFFALGILVSNLLFNSLLMWRPFIGTSVSYADYFRGSGRDHLTGVLGGMIWCLGMSFSILASDKAGPAISYGLGQGATVVAAIWGIYVWKEFGGAARAAAPKGVGTLLNGMLLCYIIGIGLLIVAR
ncbi:putative integral membrane protein [Fibrella aestuarina BUZ 2]|uniref:Putative integral membrane protein n=1 Tax=Fibrella aestuarina BUZ 2 TaxID=1166018 RepID=I0K8F1_9BACT|nr:GRP family sugar transporter [Fibrella aestuarina]CCH00404.1 putative integral membrane protein [Fibrella aestuarina BUZ 2]